MSSRGRVMSRLRQFAIMAALIGFPLASELSAAQEKPAAQAAEAAYHLHAGDSITVSVWKGLDLQRKIYIRPDGRFSFPLAGEVQAAGRTPDEVRVEIETQLKK